MYAGSQDDYYYSTQAMSENYAACLCKLWSRTFVAPLHTPFVLVPDVSSSLQSRHADASAILLQEAQIEAAIAAMDIAPEYAIYGRWSHRRRCCTCLASDLCLWQGVWLMRMVRGRAVSEPRNFREMSWIGWTVAATALGDIRCPSLDANLFWGWEQ